MAEYFGWADYVVFLLLLAASALIGVYFAFCAKRKQNTIAEYLMGGKNMGILPISMSLIATYISGIWLLGTPAEVYTFGSQIWMLCVGDFLATIVISVVYLPVFYKLQVNTSYEYLNLRFGPSVRLLGSSLFLLQVILLTPIVIFATALALNQVTGFHIHIITPVLCAVCIFYTSLGGLKAVVWTDTLQTALMAVGLGVVTVIGIAKVGGVGEVLRLSRESDRLDFFHMDVDPTMRYSFWSVLFGSFFIKLSVCLGQDIVQRCISMSSMRRASISLAILSVGMLALTSWCWITGLTIYSLYHDCDPVTTQEVSRFDQLVPFFVMEVTNNLPGLPGLFVAGIVSSALSTMSTVLNSMAGVIYTDLIRPLLKTPMTEGGASTLMKVTSALLGLLCVALVFVVEHLGALTRMVHSMLSIMSGPLLGIFTLGMFFPWANTKGALAGGITSFSFLVWISFGAQAMFAQGLITYPMKELRIDGCAADIINSTVVLPQIATSDEVFWLYRVSFMLYVLIGLVITLVVGLIVSFLTSPNDPRDISRDLLTPVIHRFLPKQLPDSALEDFVKHDNNPSIISVRDQRARQERRRITP